MTTLGPGTTIGIVGGGQLGRMLAQVARQHGYGVAVLTGGAENTPAGVLADHEFTGSSTTRRRFGRSSTPSTR